MHLSENAYLTYDKGKHFQNLLPSFCWKWMIAHTTLTKALLSESPHKNTSKLCTIKNASQEVAV